MTGTVVEAATQVVTLLVTAGILIALHWRLALNISVPTYLMASAFWEADPSEKATAIAKGISEAMNGYAFFLIVLVAVAVMLGLITIMARRRTGP